MYPECEKCEWNLGDNGCACLFKQDAPINCPEYELLLDEKAQGQLADMYYEMYVN